MTLTKDQLDRMVLEITLGLKPTLQTPEAKAMRKKLRAEIADMKRRGWSVDIPVDL